MHQARPARRTFHPLFWTLAQIGSRIRSHPPKGLEEPPLRLPPLETIWVPTRLGDVRVAVQRPSIDGPLPDAGALPPVVVHLHGGGFVNRNPEQDRHIARHLAGRLGVVVLLPDYSTAPKARYPQAEDESFDVVRWVAAAGSRYGWDGSRLVVSGVSAGAKLAINACQQLSAAGLPKPLAMMLVVPVTDVIANDRTSGIPRPAINPFFQRFVGWACFPDVDRRHEAIASPRFDPGLVAALPPTLLLTAEHDTLAPEAAELAEALRAAGVEVVHHDYPGRDHGFIAMKPVDTIRDALHRMSGFLGSRLPESTPPAG